MNSRSPITTHVLDTSTGLPAAGMEFELSRRSGTAETWQSLLKGTTDSDGRAACLPAGAALAAGVYRLHFGTGEYFERQNVATFYPAVTIEFQIAAAGEHYHVPLLISPFGYSTYRGS